jgi:hypothetical protein
MKTGRCKVGLIINFNVPVLKQGVRHLDHPDIYWERIAKAGAKQRERRESGDEKHPS